MKFDTIVVHYSATFSDQVITAADINKMHRARGFDKIGYHFFIRRDGTVEVGRTLKEKGAHVENQNAGKIGICWAGGLERKTGSKVGVDNRTPAQTAALIKLIDELLIKYPGARICGHKDLAPTLCPGFDVASWWASVKQPKHIILTSPDAKPSFNLLDWLLKLLRIIR